MAESGGSEFKDLPELHIEFQASKQVLIRFYNVAYLNREYVIPLAITVSGVVLVFY